MQRAVMVRNRYRVRSRLGSERSRLLRPSISSKRSDVGISSCESISGLLSAAVFFCVTQCPFTRPAPKQAPYSCWGILPSRERRLPPFDEVSDTLLEVGAAQALHHFAIGQADGFGQVLEWRLPDLAFHDAQGPRRDFGGQGGRQCQRLLVQHVLL